METLSERIAGVLTPDLLTAAHRQAAGDHPTKGHCYAASEAAYHLLGGKAGGWTPQRLNVGGVTHWWLRHADGTVLDITAAQFPFAVDYARGVGCGFLTKTPSKRAATIITRVEG